MPSRLTELLSGTTARRNDGSDAFNFNETCLGPPVTRGITFISFCGEAAAASPMPASGVPVAGAGRRKFGNCNPRRRITGTNTHASKPIPVKTSAPTRRLCPSNLLREPSAIRAGARAVAGADCCGAAAGCFDSVIAGAFAAACVAGLLVVVLAAGCSRGIAAEAGAFAPATGVSTTGEKVGAAAVGISSGLAGLPAAKDFGAREVASFTAALARASSGFGAVASIPAIAGAAPLFLASAAPGMGLGSIAGLASVCASANAVAASAAGAGDIATAGLWSQPRSQNESAKTRFSAGE